MKNNINTDLQLLYNEEGFELFEKSLKDYVEKLHDGSENKTIIGLKLNMYFDLDEDEVLVTDQELSGKKLIFNDFIMSFSCNDQKALDEYINKNAQAFTKNYNQAVKDYVSDKYEEVVMTPEQFMEYSKNESDNDLFVYHNWNDWDDFFAADYWTKKAFSFIQYAEYRNDLQEKMNILEEADPNKIDYMDRENLEELFCSIDFDDWLNQNGEDEYYEFDPEFELTHLAEYDEDDLENEGLTEEDRQEILNHLHTFSDVLNEYIERHPDNQIYQRLSELLDQEQEQSIDDKLKAAEGSIKKGSEKEQNLER